MTQGLILKDNQSGNVIELKTLNDILNNSIAIIIPEKDGTMALLKDIDVLEDKIKTGDVVANEAKKIGTFTAENIAKKDLSNVNPASIPAAVVELLTGPQGPQGPAGNDGIDGKDGINGTNGEIGSLIYTGATSPTSNTPGRNGVDKYLNIATGELYSRLSTGSWRRDMSLVGPQGPAGPAGADGAGVTAATIANAIASLEPNVKGTYNFLGIVNYSGTLSPGGLVDGAKLRLLSLIPSGTDPRYMTIRQEYGTVSGTWVYGGSSVFLMSGAVAYGLFKRMF